MSSCTCLPCEASLYRVIYNFIHRSAAKAFEIEGDIFKSERTKPGRNLFENFLTQHAVHFRYGNLEPHQLIVMPYSKLSKTKLPQYLFAAIDLAEPFDRDRCPISDAR